MTDSPSAPRDPLVTELAKAESDLEPIEAQRIAAKARIAEFYKKQSMRLSTALTPRVISCAEDLPQYVALPRGCRTDLEELLRGLGVALDVVDERVSREPLAPTFSEHSRRFRIKQPAHVDREAPIILRMFEKRLRGYRAIGYARGEAPLGYAERADETTAEYDQDVLAELDHYDDFG